MGVATGIARGRVSLEHTTRRPQRQLASARAGRARSGARGRRGRGPACSRGRRSPREHRVELLGGVAVDVDDLDLGASIPAKSSEFGSRMRSVCRARRARADDVDLDAREPPACESATRRGNAPCRGRPASIERDRRRLAEQERRNSSSSGSTARHRSAIAELVGTRRLVTKREVEVRGAPSVVPSRTSSAMPPLSTHRPGSAESRRASEPLEHDPAAQAFEVDSGLAATGCADAARAPAERLPASRTLTRLDPLKRALDSQRAFASRPRRAIEQGSAGRQCRVRGPLRSPRAS